MTRLMLFTTVSLAALIFNACGAPADNKPAALTNATNANTAKPTAAAPTKEALLAIDKQANDAYMKGDLKAFEGLLSDKMVMFDHGQRMDKAAMMKMASGVKCDVKDGWTLDDAQMSMIDADTYVLSYKGTFDGSCTFEGKTDKMPSPVRAASVYVRSGDKWLAAFHGENPIIDPKNPPKAEPKKEEPKKESAKKDEPKKDDKAAEAKPAAGDGNTDALVKIHTSGWEAFKAKDAKGFEAMSSANLSLVDPGGNWMSGKAAVIKQWTETMKCEGITKTSVTNGIAAALSPTVEILNVTGTADGTCDGQKNGPLNQTAFYVKEGEAWKLAFMFETIAM